MRLRRHRALWAVGLLAATAATISGLWIVTRTLRDLETQQAQTLAEVARGEAIRLALWRMDSWMTPRLAREAARPSVEYSAYYSPSGTVNRLLQSVPKGEVLSPSPLLLASPDWIPIYFETADDGTLTSPQLPKGNLLDLASGSYLSPELIEQRQAALARLQQSIQASNQSLDACTADAELSNAALGGRWAAPSAWSTGITTKAADAESVLRQQTKDQSDGAASASKTKQSSDDLASRARASNEAQTIAQQTQAVVDEKIQAQAEQAPQQTKGRTRAPTGRGRAVSDELGALSGGAIANTQESKESPEWHAGTEPSSQTVPLGTVESIGPFVPAWLSIEPPELIFVRRVQVGAATRLQGFLVDWPTLSNHLLEQIADVSTGARLVPTTAQSDAFGPTRLASIPADLVADAFVTNTSDAVASSTPAIRFAWAAAILALLGTGGAAIAGVSFGDRQARFASSVTHELRTPLTTFQLYSEMLRDDMIPDPARRQECLAALCRESRRLTHLVENVLSLARVERGARPRQHADELSASELTDVVRAIATERAGASVVTVESGLGEARVRVDRDAVSQVIANLVENAAKYGHAADGASRIEVTLSVHHTALVVVVRDHGPGISLRNEPAIWRAFDRAGAEGSSQPGLGLGLAVSRALAEGMGGSLQLRRTAAHAGAAFELRVPSCVRTGRAS